MEKIFSQGTWSSPVPARNPNPIPRRDKKWNVEWRRGVGKPFPTPHSPLDIYDRLHFLNTKGDLQKVRKLIIEKENTLLAVIFNQDVLHIDRQNSIQAIIIVITSRILIVQHLGVNLKPTNLTQPKRSISTLRICQAHLVRLNVECCINIELPEVTC